MAAGCDPGGRIGVTVAYAAPGVEVVIELRLPAGARVADAVDRSGIVASHALLPTLLRYAIFGQPALPGTPLADGDRVELLRPLRADPKDRRRERAAERPLPRCPRPPRKR